VKDFLEMSREKYYFEIFLSRRQRYLNSDEAYLHNCLEKKGFIRRDVKEKMSRSCRPDTAAYSFYISISERRIL
jgi:hypothetical protein